MSGKPKPRQRLMRMVEDSPERFAWATESWSGTIDPETGRIQEYELSIWKDTYEIECSCMDSVCRVPLEKALVGSGRPELTTRERTQ